MAGMQSRRNDYVLATETPPAIPAGIFQRTVQHVIVVLRVLN